MGEWLKNIIVLNRNDYNPDKIKKMATKLLRAGSKWQEEPAPELTVFYNPQAKWIYLYDNFINGAVPGGYAGAAKKVAGIFGSTVVYNELFDGDELVMAMAGGSKDVYVYGGGETSDDTLYAQIPFQRLNSSKWTPLLDCEAAEFDAIIDEPDVLPTVRFQQIAACLGFDDALCFCDYEHIEELEEEFADKLDGYEHFSLAHQAKKESIKSLMVKGFHEYFGEFLAQFGFRKHNQYYIRILNGIVQGFGFSTQFGGQGGDVHYGAWPLCALNLDSPNDELHFIKWRNVIHSVPKDELLILMEDKQNRRERSWLLFPDDMKMIERDMKQLREMFVEYVLPFFDSMKDYKSAYELSREKAFPDGYVVSGGNEDIQHLIAAASKCLENANYWDIRSDRIYYCLKFNDLELALCHLNLAMSIEERSVSSMLSKCAEEEREERRRRIGGHLDELLQLRQYLQNTPMPEIQKWLLEKEKKNLEMLKWKKPL